MSRLEIVKYFDSIINDLDILTETRIARDQSLEDVLNKRREEQIKFIKRVEQVSLTRIDCVNDPAETAVLEEFCFIVKHAELIFVVQVNRFVSLDEINSFSKFLTWNELNQQDKLDLLTKQNGLTKIYELIEVQIDESEYEKFFNAQSVIIDMSSWFNNGPHIKTLTLKARSASKIEKTPIQKITAIIDEIRFPASIKSNDTVSLVAEHIEFICECFINAKNIIVSLGLSNVSITPQLNKVFNLNERVSTSAYLTLINETPSQSSEHLHELELLHKLSVYYIPSSILSINTWAYIHELSFSNCSIESIASMPFKNFPALKAVSISNNRPSDTNLDWSFLDPVRKNLEILCLESIVLPEFSWKIFVAMDNLKELRLWNCKPSSFIFDHNNRLFAPLIGLRRLELSTNLSILTCNLCCELPMLEELYFTLLCLAQESYDSNQVSLSFNVPKLIYLEFKMTSLGLEDAILKFFHSFSGIQQASIELTDYTLLRNGLLKDFKSLQRLTLDCLNEFEYFDSQVFIGLENVMELRLRLSYHHDIRIDGLEKLVNVETITIECSKPCRYDPGDLGSFRNLRNLKKLKTETSFVKKEKKRQEFVYISEWNQFIFVSELV